MLYLHITPKIPMQKGPMIPIPRPAGFCLQGAWLGSYHSDCYLDLLRRDVFFPPRSSRWTNLP